MRGVFSGCFLVYFVGPSSTKMHSLAKYIFEYYHDTKL